jgi:hypothetical protein
LWQALGGLFLDVLFLGKKLLTGAMSAEMGVVPEDGNWEMARDRWAVDPADIYRDTDFRLFCRIDGVSLRVGWRVKRW